MKQNQLEKMQEDMRFLTAAYQRIVKSVSGTFRGRDH